jgi:hypothetical protein
MRSLRASGPLASHHQPLGAAGAGVHHVVHHQDASPLTEVMP